MLTPLAVIGLRANSELAGHYRSFVIDSKAMHKVTTLLKFLAVSAQEFGVAEHTYVVGGAPRNFQLGLAPKDLDLVIDSIALGPHRDSAWFAKQLLKKIPARASLVTNQYGVAIISVAESWVLGGHEMKGEVLEIANARRESYGKADGKGYKPSTVEPATIQEDLLRRDFSINTLLWRLQDLQNGPEGAQVLDLTGSGLQDLEQRVLRTPCDPDRTFTDDPTRMLRAVKFKAKYGLHIHPDTAEAITRNASKLMQMPWDAVRKILVDDVLLGPNPRESLRVLKMLGLNEPIVQLLQDEPGFLSGVSRGLAGVDTLLMLDLWDLGWHLKGSPGNLVKEADLPRLRAILEGPQSESFMQAFNKPPVDQEALFLKLNLLGPARAAVQKRAREAMLADPALAFNPKALEARVEALLSCGIAAP